MQTLVLLLLRIMLRLLLLHCSHQLENQVLLLLKRPLESLLFQSIRLDWSLYIIIVDLLLIFSLLNLIRLKLLKVIQQLLSLHLNIAQINLLSLVSCFIENLSNVISLVLRWQVNVILRQLVDLLLHLQLRGNKRSYFLRLDWELGVEWSSGVGVQLSDGLLRVLLIWRLGGVD